MYANSLNKIIWNVLIGNDRATLNSRLLKCGVLCSSHSSVYTFFLINIINIYIHIHVCCVYVDTIIYIVKFGNMLYVITETSRVRLYNYAYFLFVYYQVFHWELPTVIVYTLHQIPCNEQNDRYRKSYVHYIWV